ncbi:MAG: TetR family transcriptional regulator [Burkholderiales bacterium]|nr:TetR family transcriptional regulator [Burkholderiales bacterium]ODU61996.1 MAG: hypothetical protein ABT05_08390 [Lautropia sp. SCN 66-9]
MPKTETIDRLLMHALRAFAEHGFSGASLRTIVSDAGMPLATVHNHFQSKDALYLAVIEDCLARINRQRIALLDAARAAQPLTLRAVVDAIVDPVARCWAAPDDANRYFVLLVRQLGGAPTRLLCRVHAEYLDHTALRFAQALCQVCPHLSQERAVHHYSFLVSSVYHSLAQHERLAGLLGRDSDALHLARLVDDLKAFAVAGMSNSCTAGAA